MSGLPGNRDVIRVYSFASGSVKSSSLELSDSLRNVAPVIASIIEDNVAVSPSAIQPIMRLLSF